MKREYFVLDFAHSLHGRVKRIHISYKSLAYAGGAFLNRRPGALRHALQLSVDEPEGVELRAPERRLRPLANPVRRAPKAGQSAPAANSVARDAGERSFSSVRDQSTRYRPGGWDSSRRGLPGRTSASLSSNITSCNQHRSLASITITLIAGRLITSRACGPS